MAAHGAPAAGSKAGGGPLFEDFRVGTRLRHAGARTLGAAEVALYGALCGERRPLCDSAPFARGLGLPDRPLPELLVFHCVFGLSVPDISLNAIANLGYAELRFLAPVYAGQTLRAESQVLAVRASRSRPAGVVWVRTRGLRADGAAVLEYCRWVMVRRREEAAAGADSAPPALTDALAPHDLVVPALDAAGLDAAVTGGAYWFEDYAPGEVLAHPGGMTVEEAEHMAATRLYRNPARAHFEAPSTGGRRLVYGGQVISMCHALARSGLDNGLGMLAWNAGTHANPVHAGDTLFARTEVLECAPLPQAPAFGALRLRLVGLKNRDPLVDPVPLRHGERYHGDVVLDLDHWLLMPRRPEARA